MAADTPRGWSGRAGPGCPVTSRSATWSSADATEGDAVTTTPVRPRMNPVSGLLLLFVRGVLLWLVVPLSAVAWLVFWPLMRRRNVRVGSLVGWADLNLIAALQRSLCRFGTKDPLNWTPWVELPLVTHRIRLDDPA